MAKTILVREDLTYADLIKRAPNAKVKATLQELADVGLSAYIMSEARWNLKSPHQYATIDECKANPVKDLYDLLKSGTDAVIEYLDSDMLFVKETVANPSDEDKAICPDAVPFLISYTFNSLYKRVNAEARETMKPIADRKDQALKDKFIRYLPTFACGHNVDARTLDRVNQALVRSKQGLLYCMGLIK